MQQIDENDYEDQHQQQQHPNKYQERVIIVSIISLSLKSCSYSL